MAPPPPPERHEQNQLDAAFRAVPRAAFLLPADRRHAGHDGPLAIGAGATNSQPRTVRDMLELLEVHPGHRVLDVGAGSGWTTALLAHLADPDGMVLAVELEPQLVAFGQANLDAFAAAQPSSLRPTGRTTSPATNRITSPPTSPTASPTTIAEARPGVLGLPEHAPYDRILVSADAAQLPRQLTDQLAEGGRMVLPVRGRMTCVRKVEGGIECSEHGLYRFVPLRERR